MKKGIILMLILLILTGLTGCEEKAAADIPELLEPVGVQVDLAEVKFDTVYKAEVYSGEVVPHVEEMQFSTDGIFDGWQVAVGDLVEEGQVLAALREDTIRSQMKTLEDEMAYLRKSGELSERKSNLDIEIARLELKRLQELGAPMQECSLKELDIQKLENALAQSKELLQLQLEELQRKWNRLNGGLENNEIIAPFSGRVVYVGDLKDGDYVQSYTTVLCLTDDSRQYVRTEYIPEYLAEEADRIVVKIADREWGAEWIPYEDDKLISSALNGEEMDARFALDAPDGAVKSGQSAAVILMRSYKQNVLTIPANALYQDGAGWYVYKLENGQRVRCDVTAGVISDTKAEIKSGLQKGDMVYVKG